MLTKVLFTLIVIVAVALIFRQKTEARRGDGRRRQRTPQTGIQSKTIVYAILGLIIAISALLFFLHWQNQHRIINIIVTDGSGATATYQAYKKSIEGRSFVTLDGREVTLGDNDRVEMTSAK